MAATAIALSLASLALFAHEPAPFAQAAKARVLIFVRTDCPITNRYAPELQRLSTEFAPQGVTFWLVYTGKSEGEQAIAKHISEYKIPGTAVRDLRHELARRAHASVSPQAAVFDGAGKLEYTGRIDDRFVEIGKSRAQPTKYDLESAIAAVLSGHHPEVAATRAVGCSLADLQ